MEKKDGKKVVKQQLEEKNLEQATGGGWYQSGSFGTRGGSAFYDDPTQQAGYVDSAQKQGGTELVYSQR